jgi:hypothetical protein
MRDVRPSRMSDPPRSSAVAILASCVARSSLSSIHSLFGISSGPGAFPCGKERRVRSISYGVVSGSRSNYRHSVLSMSDRSAVPVSGKSPCWRIAAMPSSVASCGLSFVSCNMGSLGSATKAFPLFLAHFALLQS